MSEIIASSWLPLLLGIGLVLIYELMAVLPLRRQVERLEREHRVMSHSVKEATAVSVRLAPVSRRHTGQLTRLEERIGQLELGSSGQPYAQAIHRAEQGEEADRLASSYGLTQVEAKLVSLLHGRE